MQKVKSIEFLRVIACLAIILFHLFSMDRLGSLYGDTKWFHHLNNMTCDGGKAVDLFFILSGFFFAWKFKPEINLQQFIKSKIIRLWPVMIFVILLSLFVSLTTGVIGWNLYDNLLVLVGLNGTGLVLKHTGATHVASFWYVSSMLWVMIFYHYIIRHFDKKYVNLSIACIVFLSYTFLIQSTHGTLNGIDMACSNVFNNGMLRALGGIGVGYLVAEWYVTNVDYIKNKIFSLKNSLIITLLELCCVYFIVNNLLLHYFKYPNKLIYILAFTFCLILFLFNKGYISRLLNDTKLGDIFVFYGKYTYSIYIVHLFIYHILKNAVWNYSPQFCLNHPCLTILYTLTLVITSGVFLYHFVEQPCIAYFKQKVSKS